MEGEDGEEGPHFTEMDASQRWGRFDQVLGRGAFKVVYKAFDTQEGTEVAWNQVRVSELMSTKDAENKEERDRLFAEIRVLKALKHKNIMSFYDSWYDAKTYTVNFITELFTSGTLRQYRKRHKHIDEEVVKRWAWQILCGLVYLHGHNPPIIHRDLKCDNIFINGSDGVVKIGDLGLATMLRSRTAPQSVLGTPEFMAPELYEEEYDDRVDVYSFGMCLLELSTMEYPYAECKNAAQIYRKVSLGVRPLGLQKVASPELAEFINTCISPREARPRARQLLKHHYFDSIRKDKALVSSRSDAALAAAGGGGPLSLHDGASDYGSAASGPVSRTASSLNDMLAAAMAAASGHGGGAAAGGPLTGPPSASSVGGGAPPPAPPPHPLSRSISAEAHSDKAHSDSASVRSQRSNASELALAVLENIAEEGETADNSPKEAAPTGGTATPRHTPPGSPPAAGSPGKPGSPTSSDGCRCDATERRFSVRGSWLDGDKRIQLRLRICEASGVSRTVEFEFDVAVDTAASVASEMVADLELTPDDAAVIATCIRDELARLSALPEINAYASMSLAKAAEVLENSLTTSALEQAHNCSGGGLDAAALGGAASGRLLSGRFSEGPEVPAPPLAVPLSAPTPAPPLAAVLEAAAGAAPRRAAHDPPRSGSARSSFEREQPAPAVVAALPVGLRPSGASTSSLGSVSSAASIPYSVASAGSQPAAALADSGHLGSGAAAAAAAVAAAAHASTLHRLSPRGAADGGAAGPLAAGRPPPRPVSPLAGGGQAAPVEMPSPSQRVLRSTSVDAISLLTRTSSMPTGREAVASPLGAGSGALSPSSGILSPSTAVHEKRIPLNKLFENLQDLAASRTDSPSPGLEAAMAAVAAAPVPPNLPPLPHPAGGRTLPPSNSGSVLLEGSNGGGGSGAVLFRPRSEACLASLPRLMPFSAAALGGTPGSAPSGGGTLAAAADAVSPASSSAVSPRVSADGHAPLLHTTSVPLPVAAVVADGLPSLPSLPSAPPALGRIGTHALSAPPSKLPSRDASPGREASLSPTRPAATAAAHHQAQLLAAAAGGDAAAHLNGKRPPLKDKEALRRQAADAMKAVELRSLNLLEGGLGSGKAARGVPMAANRSYGSGLCAAGSAPMGGGAQPMANGGMAHMQQQGAPSQQQQQQQQAPPPAGAQQQAAQQPPQQQAPPQAAPPQQQAQQQQLKMPAHPSVSVMANGISPPAAPAPGAGPAAAPAPHIAVPAPPAASAPAPSAAG